LLKYLSSCTDLKRCKEQSELADPNSFHHSILQGERSGQWRSASDAHAVDLSVWQEVQGLGMLYLSVIAGEMNANVCARTFTSAIVV